MFKWFKIVKNQYFGFWALGLLLFAVQEIPYMIMPLLHLDPNPIMDTPARFLVLDIFEKIFGVICIVFIVLIVHKDTKFFSLKTKNEIAYFSASAGMIFLNFIGWIVYFCGIQSVSVMIIFLFALPPLYYFFIGLWRKNYFLVPAAAAFFIVHLTNAFVNFL